MDRQPQYAGFRMAVHSVIFLNPEHADAWPRVKALAEDVIWRGYEVITSARKEEER